MTLQLRLPKPWVIAVATIVVAITIFAVTCVWPWYETHRLVDEIRDVSVCYAFTEDVLPEWITRPVRDRWPRIAHYLPCRLWFACLRGPQFDDNFLRRIVAQRTVEALDLETTSVTSAGLKPLANYSGLDDLDVTDMDIADDDLDFLRVLPKLNRIGLTHTRVSGTFLGHLPNSHLNLVSFNNCPVSAAGLQELAKLPHLKNLTLRELDVSGDGLRQLFSSSSLQELHIWKCRLVEMEMAEVPRLRSLRVLNLQETQGSPAAFRNLLRNQSPGTIDLKLASIDDSVVEVLGANADLEDLILTEPGVSREAVRDLLEKANLRNVRLYDWSQESARGCLPRNRAAKIVRTKLEGDYVIDIEPRPPQPASAGQP